ncbi:cyclic pyranopterin monophosphate synthase [archaeon]|nr:cyclic pyranopterin monophosphate synthase [archaeon]
MESVNHISKDITENPIFLLHDDSKILRYTKSICPECLSLGKVNILNAIVYEKGNKIFIKKQCKMHGNFKEIYWGDAELYHSAEKFANTGLKILNPNVLNPKKSCPTKCGLCEEHESHTGLANVVITNRCNLNCWYCFFYAKEGSRIYEPDMETIRKMFRVLRKEKPVATEAVQITGGEPTLRDDLIDIIKTAREEGFMNILLNTNGIEISRKPELAQRVKKAANGGHVILYMSFDGISKKTNPKNYYEIPGVIRNARKANLNIVLVPTIIKGVNDHEIGDIIKFALANNDVIRGVNFQPVSLVGKMPRDERERRRITIPDVIRKIEEQTGGAVARSDFFPVPSTAILTEFMEALFNTHKYRLSTHFACGMATYVFIDNDSIVSLPTFFDLKGFFDYLQELEEEVKESRLNIAGRGIAIVKALRRISEFIDEKTIPENLDLKKILLSSFFRGSYQELEGINKGSLFIGMMHFQDAYNYDIDRVKKCSVHYALPDGRIVPFCAFNVIPELYRDKVQEKFSIAGEEWEYDTGKKLSKDKYKRDFTEDDIKAIEKFYTESLNEVKLYSHLGD